MKSPVQTRFPIWEGTSSAAGREGVTLEFIPPAPGAPARSENGGPVPVVLILPGGGYGMVVDHEGHPISNAVTSQGFAAAILIYRVSPHRHPAPLADVSRAVRMLRARAGEYHIDRTRVAVWGFSAGGHLAASVATLPDLHRDPADDLAERYDARPDAIVLSYPVITMFPPYAHEGSVENLLGEDATKESMRNLMSLERQVTPKNPPAFIFHTSGDHPVPVQNSIAFAEACFRNKVPAELHVFPGDKHGVGLGDDKPVLTRWVTLLMDWLELWRRKQHV